MFSKKFLFKDDKNIQEPYVRVRHTDLYGPDLGYGFVTEQNRREQELLRLPELNAAFDTVYWYRNENMTEIQEDGLGCFVDSDGILAEYAKRTGTEDADVNMGEKRRIPLSFKCDVPSQGNYRVTVGIETESETQETLIFEGRRRLVFRGCIPAGESFRFSFTVNVSDIVPRGQTKAYSDRTLDVTVVADRPRITEIGVQQMECPTLYIAGDSTVTDQSAEYPYAPGTSYAGWGQMLSAYLDGRAAVSNHSHSGLTTDSFREEGHYAIVEGIGKEGDFILFQFGHNDQKLPELKAWEGYKENLCRYIQESRAKGMYPLLVTPLARNTWKGNNGGYNDLLEEYAAVCIAVGKEMGAPVLDLHGRSCEWIKGQGLEAVKPYFYPGDFTHTNDYGAWRMAGIVAEEIKRTCTDFPADGYRFLSDCVSGTERKDDWKADGEIVLPVKPECLGDISNPEEAGDPLAGIDRLSEKADRVSALDMIIKSLRYFPVNVYNDMFDDVVGHEWYAGTVECAWQNGIIVEGLTEGRHFYPEREISLEEFLVLAMNAYRGRKRLPEEKECAYDDRCRDFARPCVRAACQLGLIAADGSENPDRILTRGEAVELCRKMKL